MARLVGKTAIVTGAASGVGEATAVRFAREGARVLVVDLNESGAEQVAHSISDAGGRAAAVRVDVSDNQQVESCIAKAIELFGGIDVLINNAGMASSHGSNPEVDPWEKGIAHTLSSVYWMSKAALPALKKNQGSIVNIASIAGNFMGTPVAWYCSAKAGVLGLTKSMATTYAPDGVRTNAICLGSVDTPRLRAILEAMPAVGAAHDRRSPLRRPGRPEEIASIALFLASEDASYVNGHTIVADGGFSLGM